MSTLVLALVRAWVRLYTRGLPADLRDARRAEIECDVWEQRRDEQSRRVRPSASALHVLGRVLRGAPSDLSWRLERRAHRGALQTLSLFGAAARRHRWTAFPALVAFLYITGAAKLGTPGFVDTPEQLAMGGGAAAILVGAVILGRGAVPVAAAWIVCLGAVAPLPLIARDVPLSLLWAVLAVRSATRRSDALHAQHGAVA